MLRLPTDLAPATCRLLRDVFGRHAVHVMRPDLPEGVLEVEAALLGLDHARLLLAGGTKLPVLVLVSSEGGGAHAYLHWLQRVLGVRVDWHSDLVSLARAAGAGGLHVHHGPVSDALATLLYVSVTSERVNLGPPLVPTPEVIDVRGHYAVVTREHPGHLMDTVPHWTVTATGEGWHDHRNVADTESEAFHFITWLHRQPLLTNAEHYTWFHPTYLHPQP